MFSHVPECIGFVISNTCGYVSSNVNLCYRCLSHISSSRLQSLIWFGALGRVVSSTDLAFSWLQNGYDYNFSNSNQRICIHLFDLEHSNLWGSVHVSTYSGNVLCKFCQCKWTIPCCKVK